jgi:hypothetical protein
MEIMMMMMMMDLMEIGWEGVDWRHLAQDRDQWQAFEHGIEHSGPIKGREFLNYPSDLAS